MEFLIITSLSFYFFFSLLSILKDGKIKVERRHNRAEQKQRGVEYSSVDFPLIVDWEVRRPPGEEKFGFYSHLFPILFFPRLSCSEPVSYSHQLFVLLLVSESCFFSAVSQFYRIGNHTNSHHRHLLHNKINR